MYYLKYRPQTVEQIDNTRGRETITKILHARELPHAFLFVGQKGTGKTSTARIFAKALNCLENKFAGKGDSIEPCNKCVNCVSINSSSSADVTELDAASNRGIDEIKSLIRESAFAPMSSKYRVFIIDEAHMITPDAFNALLKTLEEPPASVVFILATTNEEKVPKTIQSRCFKVLFGKAKKEDVWRMLNRIIKNEKLQLPNEVTDLIITHSDNSFRDAAKLLEELVIQHKLSVDDARMYVGIRSKTSLLKILETKQLKDALAWVEDFAHAGGSFKNLLEELLEELRLTLLSKNGLINDDSPEYNLTVKEISLLMKLLTEAYGMLRSVPIESLPLEMAVVEFYNKKLK